MMQLLFTNTKRFFLAITFMVYTLLGSAQVISKNQWNLELSTLLGYHFASNTIYKTGQSLNGDVKGIEISLTQEGIPSGPWQQYYGKPYLGITSKFIQLNNIDTFGYSIAIFPFYTLPVFCKSKDYLGIKIGYGMNLNTKVYHRQNNFDNRAISSNINFSLDIGFKYYHHLNNRHSISAAGGLYHVSNGSLKKPNGGLNILYGQIGYLYALHPQGPKTPIKTNYKNGFKQKWEYRFYGVAAYRQLGEVDNIVDFPAFGISQQILKNLNRLYATGLAIDLWFDPTQALLYKGDIYQVASVRTKDKLQGGIGWYNKFSIGNVFLPLSLHHYLNHTFKVKEPVYIKFGVGYETKSKFFIGLFFKGTINQKGQLASDFMEFALGRKF